FEVIINYRKYFAFSAYEQRKSDKKILSYCYKTLPGWSHDVLGNNWACYIGHKVSDWNINGSAKIMNEKFPIKEHVEHSLYLKNIDLGYALSQKHVDQINSRQNSWKATVYGEMQRKKIEHLIRMAGGEKSKILRYFFVLIAVVSECI
ncbi:hypothetical protein BLA29_013504, partial [Euroglyphus maynei]